MEKQQATNQSSFFVSIFNFTPFSSLLRHRFSIFILSLFFCFLLFSNLTKVYGQERTAPTLSQLQINMEGDNLSFSQSGLNGSFDIEINDEPVQLVFNNGKALHKVDTDHKGKLLLLHDKNVKEKSYQLYHVAKKKNDTYRLRKIPLWLSILPPLIAIGLALIFKEVVVSLFVGIWAGAFIAGGMRIESIYYFFMSLVEVVSKYVVNALNDSGHLSIVIFSLLIGGMVAIISRNGGMAGVVQAFSKYARSPRSSQFITWLLGVAIFFDDYANTLIVGNTMRSVTDKFKVSREKLAYIVDSTAAPVAAIAFITTWIGAELGYIQSGIDQLDNYSGPMSPYGIFISSLKYSFYPILALSFILIVIYFKRDFGPMHAAEVRARTTGKVSSAATPDEDEPNMEDLTPVAGAPLKWRNAVIPVLTVIFMTIFGLVDTGMAGVYSSLIAEGINVPSSGWGDTWRNMGQLADSSNSFFVKVGTLIGSSDSYVALLWASLSGVIMAILLTVGSKIMNLFNTMHTMATGFKTMLPALIILTLAWSLAITTEELHTANYLTSVLQDSLSPYWMPGIVFVLAAFIAFSTGSSWSTMAILYPIAIPTVWAMCIAQGIPTDTAMELLYNVIAIVLAASVLGDHCSPISDTTILSSLASDCNHIDHVRTQLPYALTVGAVSLAAGLISTLLGGGLLICLLLLLIGIGVLIGVVLKVGKPVE